MPAAAGQSALGDPGHEFLQHRFQRGPIPRHGDDPRERGAGHSGGVDGTPPGGVDHLRWPDDGDPPREPFDESRDRVVVTMRGQVVMRLPPGEEPVDRPADALPHDEGLGVEGGGGSVGRNDRPVAGGAAPGAGDAARFAAVLVAATRAVVLGQSPRTTIDRSDGAVNVRCRTIR